MCGIVGILGNHEASPILVDALKRLEYRGYDSSGIATINDGVLERRREIGKLVNLADKLVHQPLKGKIGIGHTRWATHGSPTLANAHPQKTGKVAVVHNGIIENFKKLRDELISNGANFQSETDTETIAQLCMSFIDGGDDPKIAAKKTLARLEGAYALCFLFHGYDNLLIAARKGSPLAIGHGNGEMFVGSDAIALAPMTNQVTYLEEGDWAVITRESLEIRDTNGTKIKRSKQTLDLNTQNVAKGNHKHFMAKEIAEQPSVLADAIQHNLNTSRDKLEISDLELDFKNINRITLVACGTAFLACNVAKYWFEKIARISIDLDVASEFRYREPPVEKNNLAIFVSQSGETADTLAALRYCNKNKMKTLGIVNVDESTIAREASMSMQIHAGPEIGVASTKAFSCQLSILYFLVIKAAKEKGIIENNQEAELVKSILQLPSIIVDALSLESEIKLAAQELSKASNAIFLGRGAMYPLALEGALKLKEISYIHAEGYASGELKHGPIALVDENMPVIVLAPKDELFDKTVSNMHEVMARGGKVLLITDTEGASEAQEGTWKTIIMPKISNDLAPILYSIPAQLLAYHTAVSKGTDVDQPRNLAKSVTVE
ncbi:glutamine--fructose-6-phosphate transaminase (isomerizing) [Amylibacter sp.]|jgi:glucosamine--fructose-6-phosphate aminotransferase (isomerizing)|nr:glutamine--fructose-6-phosphate transaminase (isomerizing) [Amylibacter sp.]MDC1420425.1 glutamine--fructose-6-phosphate transaminase (isomerizing) [bacterium]MDA9287711.1 glutamine--fructose-6-phosphate transaminase (isomerizing) [Amylibacter sp.]MDA9999902.1 glutamine--fructose-6-phosphate transaminase (isomerizing) [Amylibacter sp.]MDB4017611.1 glutamine--fructose-6-phosphate transaminase (isomerizing) [Amylibacter sp.]|tara:strand:- start:431 stop:2254 length:1824 start_codon:yes stop_codon:yes gene_type:complete